MIFSRYYSFLLHRTVSFLKATSRSGVLCPFNKCLLGVFVHNCGSAVGEKKEDFAQYVTCSAMLQEESHCVRMARDVFMEKLGIELDLERNNGGSDG